MYFRKIPNQSNQKFKGKKTIVCQNGGANLLHIDKIVNLTNRKNSRHDLIFIAYVCWLSERRHLYFRSCPNGHKLNKFLHLVTERQMHFVLTFTYKWGGGGGGGCPPSPEVFLSFFLDDKTSAPEVFIRTHFETSLVMVCYNSLLTSSHF